jgi:hypothetical protein
MAWVDETGTRIRVAASIQIMAPTRANRMNEDSAVVRRMLCGVKTEKSLPDMRIADTLPSPVKMPPHRRGPRRRGLPWGLGSISDATLFPTSFAPLAKARTKRAARPSTSTENNAIMIPLGAMAENATDRAGISCSCYLM